MTDDTVETRFWPDLAQLRYITDPSALSRYEIPERGAAGHTARAILPDDEQGVAAILRFCTAQRLPLVISAGRTGLVEAQRPEGETVLSLERLNRPLRFVLADGRSFAFSSHRDPAAALFAWWQELGTPDVSGAHLEAEAGMSVDAVNDLVAPLGLLWPLELGSSSACSVGGCVANGSAGANAVRYGTAAHLCESASGFWADGTGAGPCAGPAWQLAPMEVLAIDSTHVDPALGLIASQGLFGVITRVSLRLQERPVAREGVLVPVTDMAEAMRLLQAARAAFPGRVEEFEFIGRPALDCVMGFLGAKVALPFARGRMRDWCVLLQVEGGDSEALASELYEFLIHAGVEEADIGYAPLPVLKRIRHSITESSNVRMRAAGGGRLSFDTATPRCRFGDYLDRLAAQVAIDFPGIELIAFGHAGVGGAHLHFIGSRELPISAIHDALVSRVLDVTADFGGTFSAEHGVGPKWGAEFRRRAPHALFECLRHAKAQHDPSGILNPRSFGLLG
ncbi:MAG TPA: FAD-binding oxidoreductase [Nevskiaceae bacterium]|nr:FAD-binding oxidoreductase [Nevskiaceae bacterium]